MADREFGKLSETDIAQIEWHIDFWRRNLDGLRDQAMRDDVSRRVTKWMGWIEAGEGMRQVEVATPEPRLVYADYILSDQWNRRSAQTKQRAGNHCELCFAGGKLETHHKTYARLGHEEDNDLIVLCDDCHETFHKARRLPTMESEQ